jgi:hypothetical protein
VKNIQIIDRAVSSVYDIFAATDQEFALIFPAGQDVAFIDDVVSRENATALQEAFDAIWRRRLPKSQAMGIHGLLFYGLEEKKKYYPTLRLLGRYSRENSLFSTWCTMTTTALGHLHAELQGRSRRRPNCRDGRDCRNGSDFARRC